MAEQADAIVVGAGLAGLVAAAELADAGKRVIVVEQEGENSVGGQAFWSLGGLFFVDSPEQRRLRIRDSRELALQDWMGSAGFDRDEDFWPRRVAEAYVDFAAGEMRPWLHQMGMRWFPVVGWAERGGSFADGHGNSVPRFHITWGTGPGVVEPFERRVREHVASGRVALKFRHRVNRIAKSKGAVAGVAGDVLEPSAVERGQKSGREVVGDFELSAPVVIVASGGIGGNLDLVRKNWPVERLGPAPKTMVCGVPHHVDGRMIGITKKAGGATINTDRMWHYTEGVKNWAPIWPAHGIRILPGPSSMWFDATGNRLPAPCLPGFDTLATLKHILATGHEYSWFVLTQKIIEKEFALSGSEQNPDFTSKKWREVLKSRRGAGAPPPVEAFKEKGEDFVVKDNLADLVAGMNALTGKALIDHDRLKAQIVARDRELDNPFSKDAQITAIHGARRYLGDRLIRTARPHKMLDPKNGPLIAVRLNILTRKTLGGIHTNLDSQVLDAAGEPVPGLFAAGRGGRLRRWRLPRLQRAGGNVPRRLHLFGPQRREGGGTMSVEPKVAVVGAGPAGLATARALGAAGIDYTVFERHSDVGGLWDPENPGSPVYDSAHFISSKTMSGFAGFPMPDDYPDYPSNRQILAYIRAFADHAGLRDKIRFNTEVSAAERTDEGWRLQLGDGTTEEFTHLVAAPGTNWQPRVPELPGKFDGEVIHSVEYRGGSQLRGRRVLVVGAGNSGCDIACDAARHADAAFISLRRGYHFIPKHIFGKPSDVFAEEGPHLPLWVTQRVFGAMLRVIVGDLTKLGLPKPDHKLFESHPILNDQLLHHLRHGDIRAKGDVERLDGDGVVFRDGSRETVDLVILATGYDWPIPFVDHAVLEWEGGRPVLWMNVFAPEDPRLFVAGFVETNGGAYSFFDDQAGLIAQAIRQEVENEAAHRRFREHMTQMPDLSGGIRFVASDRHLHYADAETYRRAIKQVRKTQGWTHPAKSDRPDGD